MGTWPAQPPGVRAPAAPRSHGDSPRPELGSCSMTYSTIQSQELRTLSESLHPLKCRFPPGVTVSTLLMVSCLEWQACHRCPKDKGMYRLEIKSYSTQETRASVHPRPPPEEGSQPLPATDLPNPPAEDVPGGTIRRGTNLVGMATRKPARTSARSLCWRQILF